MQVFNHNTAYYVVQSLHLLFWNGKMLGILNCDLGEAEPSRKYNHEHNVNFHKANPWRSMATAGRHAANNLDQ